MTFRRSTVGLVMLLCIPYTALGATPTTDSKPPCNELCVVTSLANNITYENEFARECLNSRHQGSEALPLHCCPHLKQTSQWHPGQQVMASCSTLPHYTPVAIFFRTQYVLSSAGIFVGCLSDGNVGFKFIRQICDQQPELIHISVNVTTYGDPGNYYVIE